MRILLQSQPVVAAPAPEPPRQPMRPVTAADLRALMRAGGVTLPTGAMFVLPPQHSARKDDKP
jgi:hypothetical protein